MYHADAFSLPAVERWTMWTGSEYIVFYAFDGFILPEIYEGFHTAA